jgi:Common central domain of tyrosinase
MVLGDCIRRNIASVDPLERALLRDAFKELNNYKFPGDRNDSPAAGGVTWWFKQDEIHQSTHVHGGREFIPWHRDIINRMEQMLRQINPQLSLHYWDWTQDPRAIPNANLGGGSTGTLNLFTEDFMGYGGPTPQPIGEPWLSAGYYVPGASPAREDTNNPADPPAGRPNLRHCWRHVDDSIGPATNAQDNAILSAGDFVTMNDRMIPVHDNMHGFVAMGPRHRSFEDPFVFLLHSNVDRLFARWQTDPAHPERLNPDTVYGTASGSLDVLVEPWSTGFSLGRFTRPWCAPENQGFQHTYKHLSIVSPPRYDTNHPLATTI